ncbi:transposable element Tc3 transposase [Trichonephila clavipes]|nr:transposable element Tc3 transposase [Trichonephila clavipes]
MWRPSSESPRQINSREDHHIIRHTRFNCLIVHHPFAWMKQFYPRGLTSLLGKIYFLCVLLKLSPEEEEDKIYVNGGVNGTTIRGFNSGHPRGTTPADDQYIVLQARRNRRQTAGEIARHTTQATGRPISRFTVARRLHGGGLFARRPVRCVPLTPAHRRRRSLWCREHRNWRDNEWGRVLFTDESRFSLSSDSHRILIWRERGSRNPPSNIIERDRYGGRGFSFGEASCLVVVQTFTSSTQVQSTGPVIVTRFFFHMCVFLEALWVCSSLFMDDNAPCHRTVAAEQLLESRRLAARTLPPVTIRELRMALQDEWAAMPQQLIDTLILSMGRRCETCLAVREIISLY